MKTHFIFNQSVLANPDMASLAESLLKNRFPVIIISDQIKTDALKKQIDPNIQKDELLTLMGCEQADDLRALYLKAVADYSALRYLTVVFDNTRAGVKLAESLGFYAINVKRDNLQKIFNRLKITAVHQLQYLPEIKKIKLFLRYKMGYPASIFQCLTGHFTNQGVSLDKKAGKLSGGPVPDVGNFNLFINNPGDPFVLSKNFVGHTDIFEQDIINILGKYYGLPDSQARGFVTSGGTEGNFSGIWWARDNFGKSPAIALYFSEASHYSIPKIAEQLGLEPHPIPVLATESMDTQVFANAIHKHMLENPQIPIIVSANAGTTKTGAIDDIPAMKKILDVEVAQRGGRYIMHLDAACLGAVIPLLKPFGAHIRDYFADLGISTIAISAHKFFGTTSICGIILTTKKFLEESTQRPGTNIAYVGRIHDITPSGSRSGNNVLQIHNLFYLLDLHTDQTRLKKILSQCQENSRYFYQQLQQLFDPDKILWLPNSFCIIFPQPSDSLIKKYSLMPLPNQRVGVYGLINLDKNLTDLFIKDYQRELKT